MSYSHLPPEIILSILRYGGQKLGLANEPIIDEIRLYDPSFDYSGWQGKVQRRKDLIGSFEDISMQQLYQYIKDNNITMVFDFVSERIMLLDASSEQSNYIVDILREMGYSFAISDITYLVGSINDMNKLHERMLLMWYYKEPSLRESEHNWIIHSLTRYPNIADKFRLLDTPTTLSDYLRHIIDRSKATFTIKQKESYPLYTILSPYRWSYNHVDKELKVIAPKIVAKRIASEFSRLGIKYSNLGLSHSNLEHTFIAGCDALVDLLRTDMVLNPSTPFYIDQFY